MSRRMPAMYIFMSVKASLLLFLIFKIDEALSANWAQISGRPYMKINSVPETPWEDRWGHSACNFQSQRMVPCNYLDLDESVCGDPDLENCEFMEKQKGEAAVLKKNAAEAPDQSILVVGGDTYDVDTGVGKYRNDVWSGSNLAWDVFESEIEKDKWGRKKPIRRSEIRWKNMASDNGPPENITYYEWIGCAASRVMYHGIQCDDDLYIKKIIDENNVQKFWHPAMKCQCDIQYDRYGDTKFSPRRGHSSVAFRQKAYILGGRARNFDDLPYDEAVGGIPTDNHVLQLRNATLRVRNREKSILMNDVWETDDGIRWKLTSPGCRPEVLQETHSQDNGHERTTCTNDGDCWGSEKCVQNGCVCQMWSPREQFAVEVFPPQENFIDVECPKTGPESRIYIFGGFGSRYVQKCGENACNLEYREYYHDVWRSKKECIKLERNEDPTGCRSEHAWFAQEWEMVTPAAPWRGRGGHQVVVHQMKLFLMGGQGGNIRDPYDHPLLNDVWSSEDGVTWVQKMANAEWSPRKNFNAGSVMSVKNKRYGPSRGQKISESYEYLYVFGGFDGDSRLDDCYESLNGTAWLKDYSEPGTYNDGTTHDGTSSMLYVRPSSDVRKLGMMTDEQIQLLYDEGITTIEELAGADRSIIMKLRGGSYEPDPLDGPEQYRGGDFRFVCPIKKRAESVMQECRPAKKRIDGQGDPCPSCSGNFELDITTGLDLHPHIEYGGPTWEALISDAANPEYEDEDGCNPPKWMPEEDEKGDIIPRDDDDLLEEEMEKKLNEEIGGYQCVINVSAYGEESEVCSQGKVNLTCMNLFSPRDFAASVVIKDKQYSRMYIIGGRIEDSKFENDVWYRDGASPDTRILMRPKPPMEIPGTDQFQFMSDELPKSMLYEYRVFDADNETNPDSWELKRNWTYALSFISLHDFLPEWIPSSGIRRLEVRGVDPAGNVDMFMKEEINTWMDMYDAPKPWGLIISGIIAVVLTLVGSVIEVRRRQRKKAMERYAIKRMRRKFKGAQRAAGRAGTKKGSGQPAGASAKDENIDWKKYYNENKK